MFVSCCSSLPAVKWAHIVSKESFWCHAKFTSFSSVRGNASETWNPFKERVKCNVTGCFPHHVRRVRDRLLSYLVMLHYAVGITTSSTSALAFCSRSLSLCQHRLCDPDRSAKQRITQKSKITLLRLTFTRFQFSHRGQGCSLHF